MLSKTPAGPARILCGSFPSPSPNSDWQRTKHMDAPFCAQQSRQEHHPPLTFPFSCGVSRQCLYPTYQLPCCCCSVTQSPFPSLLSPPQQELLTLGTRLISPNPNSIHSLWSSCCGKFLRYSEPVERHPGKVCDRREEHSSLP